MRSNLYAAIAVLLATVVTAAPQPPGPAFDVVSIRPSPGSVRLSNTRERPGGSFVLEKGTAEDVIVYAYALPPENVIGLPGWALRDVYDIAATASVASPTLDDRRAMVGAMLADRFRLRAHYETRELPSFDLVKARPDGRLGGSLIPYEVDCESLARAGRDERAAGNAPPRDSKEPPCTARITRTGLVGEMHMGLLAGMLRSIVGRPVVDKTVLTGSYRVQMQFDPSLGMRTDTTTDAGPSVFAALQEQLGLKLEPSRTPGQVLVIDRLERPTPN